MLNVNMCSKLQVRNLVVKLFKNVILFYSIFSIFSILNLYFKYKLSWLINYILILKLSKLICLAMRIKK